MLYLRQPNRRLTSHTCQVAPAAGRTAGAVTKTVITRTRCNSPTSVPTGWRRIPATARSSSIRYVPPHLDRPYTPLYPPTPPYTPLRPRTHPHTPAHTHTHPHTPIHPHTLPVYPPHPPVLPSYQGSAVTYHLSGRKVRAAPPCAAGGVVSSAKAAPKGVVAAPDTLDAAPLAAHGACQVACTVLGEAAPPPEGAEGFVRGAAWGSAVVAGLDRVRTPAAAGTRPFRGRCFACGQKGHSKDHCPQWQRADLDRTGGGQRPIVSASRVQRAPEVVEPG